MRRMLLPVLLLLAACSAAPPDEAELSASASMPLQAPVSSTAASGEVVHRWPDTTENTAGPYSWNGSGCGKSCNSGFMHNCYGACDVEIHIGAVTGGGTRDDGAAAVAVAGHEGTYRRLDAQNEEWTVDMHGTAVSIRVVQRGDSGAGLAEAHAIIDSMYPEPADNGLGFRLVFRLTTDDWDSG